MRSALSGTNPIVGRPLEQSQPSVSRASFVALGGLLLVAFIVRLLFISQRGYSGDVGTFEAWALALAEHPVGAFYSSSGFADYPPGYFVVLLMVGHAYKLLVHNDPGFETLRHFVKMPAILMDLVCTTLIFAIVARIGSLKWAFVAAAVYALNPATIYISASWGQVDSVSAAFVLGALYMALLGRERSDRTGTWLIIGAWLAFSYSVLIKPHALVIAPLLAAVPFAAATPSLRWAQVKNTLLGMFASLLLALAISWPFHQTANPVELLSWLWGRYSYGSGVYAYNSINAFNLHTIFNGFWKPDTVLQPGILVGGVTLGLPQFVWGILLVVAAVVLIVWRFLQLRTDQAFLEAACLLALSYFMLSTRMHERYVFNAFVLAIPLAAVARRYLYAAVVLTITLFANLEYSLYYLYVMDNKVQGVNAGDLWPGADHLLSLVNALVLFFLLFAYLGTQGEVVDDARIRRAAEGVGEALRRSRTWFLPLEGVVRMTRPDYAIAAALSVASFVLSFVNYAVPGERIFDEIYYARAGEEYLGHKDIFEFTHPPLTKLVVALSMMLFGGLHGGNNSTGWRFLQLLLGALMVFALYVFAKRLLGSTAFATAAAGMLLFDGFHFVQSRIATPEIGVALLSLTTAYAFYRYWLARQVRVAASLSPRVLRTEGIALAGAFALTLALTWIFSRDARPEQTADQVTHARLVLFAYFMSGFYFAIRALVPRLLGAASEVSYADGSYVSEETLHAPDGATISATTIVPGELSASDKKALVLQEDELRIVYERDASAQYQTPAGDARFLPSGTMQAGPATVAAADGRLWFALFVVSAGLLAASKWNGLFTIVTALLVAAAVAIVGYWPALAAGMDVHVRRRPAIWGNPRGFSYDMLLAGVLFGAMSLYALAYVPYFSLNKNVTDVVELQYGMYEYHHNLHAQHPYASVWWQWPLLERPIQYFYKDTRKGADQQDGKKCCILDIMALPNPVIWWFGLFSIPAIAVMGWKERNKGLTFLALLYVFQWLPWIASPRLAFEYHFFPNLALICLANAAILQRLWERRTRWMRYAVGGYAVAVVVSFIYFYPLVSGMPLTQSDWTARITTLPKLVLGNERAWI